MPCVSFALFVLIMETENILIKCPLLNTLADGTKLCDWFSCDSHYAPATLSAVIRAINLTVSFLTSLCCLPRICTSSPTQSSAHTVAYLTEQKQRVT